MNIERPAGVMREHSPVCHLSSETRFTDSRWGGVLESGHIKLELPVFHIGYFKHTIAILQCICKRCARVMVRHRRSRSHPSSLLNTRSLQTIPISRTE
jgi:DNA-directed RNA polymerase beta' subunit